eukprot:190732-Chlamydomonas_euryale.AAC.21
MVRTGASTCVVPRPLCSPAPEVASEGGVQERSVKAAGEQAPASPAGSGRVERSSGGRAQLKQKQKQAGELARPPPPPPQQQQQQREPNASPSTQSSNLQSNQSTPSCQPLTGWRIKHGTASTSKSPDSTTRPSAHCSPGEWVAKAQQLRADAGGQISDIEYIWVTLCTGRLVTSQVSIESYRRRLDAPTEAAH